MGQISEMNPEYIIKALKKVLIISCMTLFIILSFHYMVYHPQTVKRTTSHSNDASYVRMFKHNKPHSTTAHNLSEADAALVQVIKKFSYKPKTGKPKKFHRTPQTAVNMALIRDIFLSKWKESKANFTAFRQELNSYIDSHKYFAASQETVVAGEQLTMAHQDNVSRTVFPDIHERLPKESPFKGKMFPRCAVMGSSGMLSNSNCGEEIDSADYVFRCNIPPMKDFMDDAGSRTNLTTMNIMTIVADRYHLLSTSLMEDKFLRDLQEYSGYLWLPVYGMGSTYSFGLRVFRLLDRLNGTNLKPMMGHPEHFRGVKKLWEKRDLKHRPSTGLYLTTTAIALCDKVDLYGFWPLPRDINGNEVPYHYYEDKPSPTIMHDFHFEFLKLAQLHEKGIVHIHTGKCKDVEKAEFT